MSTLALRKPNDADALRALMHECASALDLALTLKVGVMDSESKANAIAAERVAVMQDVAERLRRA
jgi:hypothetical protein